MFLLFIIYSFQKLHATAIILAGTGEPWSEFWEDEIFDEQDGECEEQGGRRERKYGVFRGRTNRQQVHCESQRLVQGLFCFWLDTKILWKILKAHKKA